MARWPVSALILLLGLLAGCSPPPPPPGPGKIRPGEGVEEVRLGQSRTEVEEVLGPPEEAEPNPFRPESHFALYYSRGLEIAFDRDRVSMITLHRAGERWSSYPGSTVQGLGVESDPREIRRLLGDPGEDLPQALKYLDRGLWFRLDREGRVESLSLVPAGSEF